MRMNGDSLHYESPEDHATWDGKLDGTPAPVKGPAIPDGLMVSEKLESPNKMVSVATINGKEIGRSEDTLSADGKSFTEINWDPAKPNEKQTLIYEKQ